MLKKQSSAADLVFYGGTIHSMDANFPNPEAVAVKGERIMAVGSKDEIFKLRESKTKMVKLEGNQTLLPGFIEPHQHAIQLTLTRCMYVSCSAYYYQSYEDIQVLFQETLAQIDPASGKWCIFLGWDPEMIRDLPKLNFDALDGLTTTIPLVVIGQSGHTAWSNRKAFEVAEIPDDIENPRGGTFVRDPATGELTGQMLEEPAMMTVLGKAPPPSSKEVAIALEEQWNEYSNAGFTTVTDLAYMPNEGMDSLLQLKASRSDCPIRLGLYELDSGSDDPSATRRPAKLTCCHVCPSMKEEKTLRSSHTITENDKLWVAGIKMIADGSPHCGTSAVRDEYLHNDLTETLGFPPSPCYGKLNFEPDYLLERVKYYHAQGKQVAIHTHGERAIEQALSVLEKVEHAAPKKDLRHRVEHLGLCEEQHIKQAAKSNVAMSFFVAHLYFYGTSYTDKVFGAARTNRWAPLSLALKHKILWTIHQDHPTFPGPPEPFANLMTAVTRTERGITDKVYGSEYCIKMEEALKGYTINAARQIHQEKELGSLTADKRADLLILSEDPVKVADEDPFRIVDIKVVDTYLNGRSNADATSRGMARKCF